MTQVISEKQHYLEEFERFSKDLSEPDWLRGLRQDAMSRFERLGFPTPRTEDWRFTSVGALAQEPFELADEAAGELPTLRPAPVRLLFVNGRFTRPAVIPPLPRGVVISTLEAELQRGGDLLETYLARQAEYKDQAFTALNTAFLRDGLFVFVPKGTVLEQPIEVVFASDGAGKRTASHPRVLVIAEANSQFRLVERYMGGDDEYLNNAVTEVALGENAIGDHYKLQTEGGSAYHIANTQVVLSRGSNFTTHYISLGGRLVRNEVRARFDGEGAEATVNGLYLAGGKQHVDNFTVIDHAKPHCASHELYKGILADKSHGVFNGKIFVRQDAQKTDAKQTNKVLLLSEDAVINTKPQLEIFADDVKCTHGATVGQLDAEALFYMRARGIGVEEARNLLIYAFANDIVSRIKVESLREELETALRKLRFAAERSAS